MTGVPCPSADAYAAMRARAERAEQLAAGRLDALRAVLEALAIPYPATVGDGDAYDRVLAERVMHAVVTLRTITDPGRPQADWYVPHSVAYLRARLAEHPATGYRASDDVRAGQAGKDGAR